GRWAQSLNPPVSSSSVPSVESVDSLPLEQLKIARIDLPRGVHQHRVHDLDGHARLQRDPRSHADAWVVAALSQLEIDLLQVLAHRLLGLDDGTGGLEEDAADQRVAGG